MTDTDRDAAAMTDVRREAVAALAEALHHAMCEWSAHDGLDRTDVHWRDHTAKYGAIAESVGPALAARVAAALTPSREGLREAALRLREALLEGTPGWPDALDALSDLLDKPALSTPSPSDLDAAHMVIPVCVTCGNGVNLDDEGDFVHLDELEARDD